VPPGQASHSGTVPDSKIRSTNSAPSPQWSHFVYGYPHVDYNSRSSFVHGTGTPWSAFRASPPPIAVNAQTDVAAKGKVPSTQSAPLSQKTVPSDGLSGPTSTHRQNSIPLQEADDHPQTSPLVRQYSGPPGLMLDTSVPNSPSGIETPATPKTPADFKLYAPVRTTTGTILQAATANHERTT
jgi:hypothetical protein